VEYRAPTQAYAPIHTGPVLAKVYSAGQVAGAAFLGGPIAGCVLLGSNFGLFGNSDARQQALGWGVIATVGLWGITLFLPENFPAFALPAAYTFALHRIAERLQGGDIRAFFDAGGQRQSNLRVVGIGFLCAFFVLAAAIALMMVLPPEILPEGIEPAPGSGSPMIG